MVGLRFASLSYGLRYLLDSKIPTKDRGTHRQSMRCFVVTWPVLWRGLVYRSIPVLNLLMTWR